MRPQTSNRLCSPQKPVITRTKVVCFRSFSEDSFLQARTLCAIRSRGIGKSMDGEQSSDN